jgi:hypothetical protein
VDGGPAQPDDHTVAHPTLAPPPTDQPGPGWPVSRLVAGIGVLVVVVALLIWLTAGAPGRPARFGSHRPDHTPSLDRDGLASARLQVSGGVDRLTVTAADLGGHLIEARTPGDERAVPVLDRTDSGGVSVITEGRDDGGDGATDLTVRLSDDVRWSVVLDSGTQLLTLDLASARLRSVDVDAGVSSIDAELPRPGGLLTVRVAGGASAVHLRGPSGVPARLTFAGGGGSAVVDGAVHGGLGGGAVLATPDWPASVPSGSAGPDRFDVVLASGIGSLTFDRAG